MSCRNLFLRLACLLLGPCCMLLHAQGVGEALTHQLFQQERWEELVRAAQAAPDRPTELQFEYSVALAHLQRWQEAEDALRAGMRFSPADKRFPTELAGVLFRQKKYN